MYSCVNVGSTPTASTMRKDVKKIRNSATKVFIRRSCITGKVVWIYIGPSEPSAVKAYCRARCSELKRFSKWAETVTYRMANVKRLLNDCMQHLPINAELTPQQQQAVRQLLSIAKQTLSGRSEFYEHIMEENRRKQQDVSKRKK